MKQHLVISLIFFSALLVFKSEAHASTYKYSGNCEVFAKNSKTGEYDIPNGSGFLTAKDPKKNFRGMSLEEHRFVMTAHQNIDEGKAIRSGNFEYLSLMAKCGNITFELEPMDPLASKKIRTSRSRTTDVKNPKECEWDRSTGDFNRSLEVEPYIWAACDLAVHKIRKGSISGNLEDVKPYSTELERPAINTYSSVVFEIINEMTGKKVHFVCPVERYFAGGLMVGCSKSEELISNVNTSDDVYRIGISSGSVALANDGKKLIKINGLNAVIGVVKKFFVDKNKVFIIIENLEMSRDVFLPSPTTGTNLAR